VTTWKHELKLADLASHTQIECTCRRCQHVRYLDSSELLAQGGLDQLYLDEVETRLTCRKSHCRGPVRIALVHDDTEGFVGGLA
jgi:hypothetical protein